MIHLIRKILNPLNCDLVRYPHHEDKRFIQLLLRLNIDTLFDIGANVGQFASEMRSFGYKKAIVSFEPLDEAFKELKKKSSNDVRWTVCHSAVGNDDGEIEINVSRDSVCSSILEREKILDKTHPMSVFYKKEKVSICKIDSVIDKYIESNSNVFVKIDTQGFEKNVIDGAQNSISSIKGFIMELSFVSLYKSETLFMDMIPFMKSIGYELWQIIPVAFDNSNQRIVQANIVFVKQ